MRFFTTLQNDIFTPLPFTIIDAFEGQFDHSPGKLVRLINRSHIDVLIFVGIDIWRYEKAFRDINILRQKNGFKWIVIAPYDLWTVRKDWLLWFKQPDISCIYSEYGYNLLKDHLPNVRYFRPPLNEANQFIPYDEEKRSKVRRTLFPSIGDDQIVFGFIGNNQVRKDPLKVVQAFYEVKKTVPNAILYLHTSLETGVYNLKQYMKDMGLKTGDIISKVEGKSGSTESMVNIYNSIDFLVNASFQEGLSWTLVEAMLCGTPVIATYTTAQIELIEGVGIPVLCNEPAMVPMYSESGSAPFDTFQCKLEDLTHAMMRAVGMRDDELSLLKTKSLERGNEWLDGVHNINGLLEDLAITTRLTVVEKNDDVLFCQKSSAGDVLMTTRCLKGLKERHKGAPLVYMTSRQYMDILEGNPYIEGVIPWDDIEKQNYKFVYDIHNDIILPGHWGRNCNSILSDFYWKILDVEPDDFFIELKKPEGDYDTPLPICIVHTTGGDAQFRTYKYMGDVCKALKNKYTTVQLGEKDDYPAMADIDLRGKLSFRESAWVMNKAVLAVTVDSFMSHLAGALGISQVCLFGSGNENVVKPNQMKGELICLSPDYVKDCKGLGPCSAAVRDCPAPCTGKHNPIDILEAIHSIELNGNIRRNT